MCAEYLADICIHIFPQRLVLLVLLASYFGDAITERYYAFAVRSVCIYSICVLMTNMNSLSVSMYVCIVLLYILLGI